MKSIIGYICCIILTLAYTFIWDGKCGIYILYVLIISPIISIAITLMVKNKIKMSLSSSTNMLHKGENVNLSVTFSKTVPLPTPLIKVTLFNPYNLSSGNADYILSLGMKKSVTIHQNYSALIWGATWVGISEVTMSDFLGLLKFTLYKEIGRNEYVQRIDIYPEVPDSPVPNDLMQAICNTVAYEDNEETKEGASAIRGIPGYEHRAYRPGDSIKRINWKLSSKRNELLVRMDEEILNSRQVIILDRYNSQLRSSYLRDIIQQLKRDELIVEAVLAFLSILVKQGVESDFYFFTQGVWTRIEVSNENDISNLQYLLAKFQFQPKDNRYQLNRIPISMIEEQKKVTTITLFTSSMDEGLINQYNDIDQKGIMVNTVVTEPTNFPVNNIWLVNQSFEFRCI